MRVPLGLPIFLQLLVDSADVLSRPAWVDASKVARQTESMKPNTYLLASVALASALASPAFAERAEPGKQVGKASYYAQRYAGRTMANGEPMQPQSNNAASRTLPLGTHALVTNLENGRTAEVVIKDRGPYVTGRIIDVSPRTAEVLGMVEDGVADVKVVPLYVPQKGD
jgi:rare lipoprotein A